MGLHLTNKLRDYVPGMTFFIYTHKIIYIIDMKIYVCIDKLDVVIRVNEVGE